LRFRQRSLLPWPGPPATLLRSDLVLVIALAAIMLATYAITWWLHTAVFRGTPQEAAVQALTVAFPNCAAVGLALLPAVYGPVAQSVAAIGVAVGAITISPLTIALLEREAVATHRFSRAFLHAFRRPVVFAPILGVLVAFSGIALHDVVSKSLLLLGQGAAGIALFLTGVIVSSQRFHFTRSIVSGVVLKNLIQPLVLFLVLTALRFPAALRAEATLLAAVPAGFFGTVFGDRFGVRSFDASATLLASTVLSVVTLGVTIFLLQGASHLAF
jgi:malonate transporter and related proteins